MTVYLGSPGSQMHAHMVRGMPVLVSFAIYSKWLDDYQASFGPLLVDSGAFSVIKSGKVLDVVEFAEWSEKWRDRADAIACLDDIAGDWQKGWKNMEAMPAGIGFPTFHDADPWELLPDLCAAARERGGWIGVGMTPTKRNALGGWLRDVLAEIPDDLHVHGWALRGHWKTHPRLNSVDSTNWFLDSWQIKNALTWLTPAECVELVVTRYKRETREIIQNGQERMFT